MSIHDSGSSRSIGGEFEQPNTSEGEEQEFKVHLAGQPFVIAINPSKTPRSIGSTFRSVFSNLNTYLRAMSGQYVKAEEVNGNFVYLHKKDVEQGVQNTVQTAQKDLKTTQGKLSDVQREINSSRSGLGSTQTESETIQSEDGSDLVSLEKVQNSEDSRGIGFSLKKVMNVVSTVLQLPFKIEEYFIPEDYLTNEEEFPENREGLSLEEKSLNEPQTFEVTFAGNPLLITVNSDKDSRSIGKTFRSIFSNSNTYLKSMRGKYVKAKDLKGKIVYLRKGDVEQGVVNTLQRTKDQIKDTRGDLKTAQEDLKSLKKQGSSFEAPGFFEGLQAITDLFFHSAGFDYEETATKEEGGVRETLLEKEVEEVTVEEEFDVGETPASAFNAVSEFTGVDKRLPRILSSLFGNPEVSGLESRGNGEYVLPVEGFEKNISDVQAMGLALFGDKSGISAGKNKGKNGSLSFTGELKFTVEKKSSGNVKVNLTGDYITLEMGSHRASVISFEYDVSNKKLILSSDSWGFGNPSIKLPNNSNKAFEYLDVLHSS
jgi:hypothetical protein